MNRTRISLLIIVALSFSSIPFGIFIVNTAADTTTTLPDYEPMDIGYKVRASIEHVDAPSLSSMEAMPRTSVMADYQYVVGDQQQWLAYWSGAGYYWDWFELRAMNDVAEIWVALDMNYPDGDPRNPVEVTDEQVEYMLEEFSGNIIPTDEGYFGEPDELYGNDVWGDGAWADPDGKKVMLVENIIDDSYFNSAYPAYVVGVYSPTIEYYLDRNVITVDGYDWANRIGDDSARPNLYESTVAHEYQHLIQDDYIAEPESWMNEACSLFAEPLCGYELDTGQIGWFLATPDNSLTQWGDQGDINILADYGSSFLWALFLTSHYGFDFMGRYVQGGVAGIEGINNLLPKRKDFLDVFHDWRIANLLQTDHGRYGYTVFDFSFEDLSPIRVYDVEGKDFDWMTASEAFGETMAGTSTLYHTGIDEVSSFGSDYILLKDLTKLNRFYFDGEDEELIGWKLTDMGWYSGAADLYDALLYTPANTVEDGDMLTINTYWDIEEGWDFGFVQISTDDGVTWTSLENEYTTDVYDPQAHPDIIAELPGLTGWSTYVFMDDAYYVFHEISYDLSDYVGENAIFRFRYMTDWGYTEEGWYISEADLGGTPLELTPYYPENEIDFMVTILYNYEHKWFEFSISHDMWLCDFNEYGSTFIVASKWTDIYVIVTPMFGPGFADYQFKSTNKHRHGHCHWF